MASQQITEILTRIVVDTTQAEEALRRFAAARDRALDDAGATTRQSIAQEIDARIAAVRRGVDAEVQLRNQAAVSTSTTRVAVEAQTQDKIVGLNVGTVGKITAAFDGGARQSAASRITIENQVQGQIAQTSAATSAKMAATEIQNARAVGAAKVQIARDTASAEAAARRSFLNDNTFRGQYADVVDRPIRPRGVSAATLNRAADAGINPLYFDGIARDVRGLQSAMDQLSGLRTGSSGADPKIARAISRLESEIEGRRQALSARLGELSVGFTMGRSGRMSELQLGQAFVGTRPGDFRSVPITGNPQADREALKSAVRDAFGAGPLAGAWASMSAASGLPSVAIDPSVRTSLNKAVALGLTTAQEAAYARLPGGAGPEVISIPDLLRFQTSGPRGAANKNEIVRLIGGRLDDVDGAITEALTRYERARLAVAGKSGDAARAALRDAGLGQITPVAQALGLVRQGPGATGAGNAPDAGLNVDKEIAALRARIRELNQQITTSYTTYLRKLGAMSAPVYSGMEDLGLLRLVSGGTGYQTGSLYDESAPLPLANETISPWAGKAFVGDPVLRQIVIDAGMGKTPRMPSDRMVAVPEGMTATMQNVLAQVLTNLRRNPTERVFAPDLAYFQYEQEHLARLIGRGLKDQYLSPFAPRQMSFDEIVPDLLSVEGNQLNITGSSKYSPLLASSPSILTGALTASEIYKLTQMGAFGPRYSMATSLGETVEPIQVFGQRFSPRTPLLPGQIVTPSSVLFEDLVSRAGRPGSPSPFIEGSPSGIFTVDPRSLTSVGTFDLNDYSNLIGSYSTGDAYSFSNAIASQPQTAGERALSPRRQNGLFTGLYRYTPTSAAEMDPSMAPSYLQEQLAAIAAPQQTFAAEDLITRLRELLFLRRRGMASPEFLTGGIFGSAADRTASAGFEQLSFGFGGGAGGGGEDPEDSKRNEEKITENQRAERAKRAADLRRANAETRLQSARLRDDLSDIFRVGPALADRITGIDDLRFGLQAATQQATIARTELSRLESAGAPQADVIAAQDRLNKALAEQARIAGRLGGPGGLARGVAGAFVSTAIQAAIVTPIYAAAQAAVQFGFEETSKYIDRLINPTKAATVAFDALGQSVASLGGAEKFGKLLGLGPELQAIAASAEKINQNKASFDALTQLLLTSALAGGTGQSPEQFVFDQRLKQNRETILEQLGFGNPFAALLTGITPGSEDLARRQATGMGPEALAAFNRVLEERRGGPISQGAQLLGQAFPTMFGPTSALLDADALKAALAAAADESFRGAEGEISAANATARRKEIAGGLVAALRSGQQLTREQLDVLKDLTTEEQRRALFSFAARDAIRQETAARTELQNILEDIAILEGRSSGDLNKDALDSIRRRREDLDSRERAIEERAFRRQRQQALDEIQANISRAGIRQAGQTSFDVYAAQREAEAQAERQRQGFRDEDERRAITKIRRELDAREKAIRETIELETLRSRVGTAEDNLRFAELNTRIFEVGGAAATVIEQLFNAGIAGAQALAAVVGYGITGTSLGRDGYGGRYAAGGRVSGMGPILVGEYGPELFIPDSSGTIASNARLQRGGETTIVLEPMNIVLDGEVIGRTLERRVTARSNRRASFGIA